MSRSMMLAYWEIRRILRAKIAVFSILLVPLLFVLGNVLFSDGKTVILKTFFPGVSIVSVWIFLCIRAWFDRASGFTFGLDSTPAVGGIVLWSRILTGIILVMVQIGVFLVAVKVIY